MIILRLATGIKRHFEMRFSEWIMTYPMICWFLLLRNGEGGIFGASRAFDEVARLASEPAWAMVCLSVAGARLFALGINGTFKTMPYSPHFRLVASIIAAFFWGQITLGTFIAWYSHDVIATAFIAYSTFTWIEVFNIFRAATDVGASGKGAMDNARNTG